MHKRVLDILLERGLVRRTDLSAALEYSICEAIPLTDALYLKCPQLKGELPHIMADEAHLPYVPEELLVCDTSRMESLPSKWLQRLQAVPITGFSGNTFAVAEPPDDLETTVELESLTGRKVEFVLSDPDTIARHLAGHVPMRMSRGPESHADHRRSRRTLCGPDGLPCSYDMRDVDGRSLPLDDMRGLVHDMCENGVQIAGPIPRSEEHTELRGVSMLLSLQFPDDPFGILATGLIVWLRPDCPGWGTMGIKVMASTEADRERYLHCLGLLRASCVPA